MLEELNERFAVDHQLRFEEHESGLIQGCVRSKKCNGSFFLLGGHVAEFQPHGQAPLLFLSTQSRFEVGKPIRGGVPLCFPWFGPHEADPDAPAHGLARTQVWDVSATEVRDEDVVVTLTTEIQSFELEYNLRFGESLDLEMRVGNRAAQSQSYELALHTYFQISDVADASISGLEDVSFFDKLTGETQPAEGRPIVFREETDRIYQATVEQISLQDRGWERTVLIRPRGSQSTVVWNPWTDKARKMADFGDREYPHMGCVETANVGPQRVHLAPGEQSTTGVTLSLVR